MGMFSWFTSDEHKRIVYGESLPVWMKGRDGRVFFDGRYSGYGQFGVMDYYVYLAELNGQTSCPDDVKRDVGIMYAFDDEHDTIYPRLFSNPESLKGDPERFPPPEMDPDQGFAERW